MTYALRAPPPLAWPSSFVMITEPTSTFSLKARAWASHAWPMEASMTKMILSGFFHFRQEFEWSSIVKFYFIRFTYHSIWNLQHFFKKWILLLVSATCIHDDEFKIFRFEHINTLLSNDHWINFCVATKYRIKTNCRVNDETLRITFHRKGFWLLWRSVWADHKHQHGKYQHRQDKISSLSSYSGMLILCKL